MTTAKKISISEYAGKGFSGFLLRMTGPILDLILGIRKINTLYQNSLGENISKEEFLDKLLDQLAPTFNIPLSNKERIPHQGPLIIVANHPYGGLEGIILANLLSSIRPDVKILANIGLKVFPELQDFFIYTNPLVTHNPKNIKSIKNCREHLENGGLLLLFPAGKVSYYRKDKKRITDGKWNRIAAHLSLDLNIPVMPMFISGHNSSLFLFLGKIYYRFKLLMLPREFAKKKKEAIEIRCGFPFPPTLLNKKGKSEDVTAFLRMSTYILDPRAGTYGKTIEETVPELRDMPPLLRRPENDVLKKEIENLPESQHLTDFKNFSVYYGYKKQIKNIVHEITILREETFRGFNEGSGQPCDTDRFDETYTHLFIWDNEQDEIIGSYRMGQTDLIPERYLSHMFQFTEDFKKSTTPSLEMGRSFIIEKHQKSFYGLFLLWRGIGEFCVRNPQYRKLYGSVSLSNIYNKRSISLIDRILMDGSTPALATIPFIPQIHDEVMEYIQNYSLDFKDLSTLVKSCESDGKDVPILLKQYWKMGAKFYLTAIDDSFLETPGLLLVVNLPEAPKSSLKMYLEDGLAGYLQYDENKQKVDNTI